MKMNIWIIVIVLLVVGVWFLLGSRNSQDKKVIVVMKDKADNEFAAKGMEEFSSNFDVEWLDTFQKNLKASNVIIGEEDFDKIKLACGKVHGDTKKVEKINSDIKVDGQVYHANIIVEWDNVMGYLLRIYCDKKELIKTIEKIWVKTTEELGV
jgi:hypothetical protein